MNEEEKKEVEDIKFYVPNYNLHWEKAEVKEKFRFLISLVEKLEQENAQLREEVHKYFPMWYIHGGKRKLEKKNK